MAEVEICDLGAPNRSSGRHEPAGVAPVDLVEELQ